MSGGSLPFDAWAAEWIAYAAVPSVSLAQKCLKMSQVLERPDLDISSQMATIRELAMLGGRRPMYGGLDANMSGDAAGTGGALRHILLDSVMERGYGYPLAVAVICREALGYAGYAAAITASPERPHLEVNSRALDMVGNRPVEPGRPPLPEPYILAHLLHILRRAYMRLPDHQRVLRCIAMARGMGADHPCHDRDIGIILHRRGDERAAWWLKRYLRANPDAHDIEQVEDLIASMERR
ncbi:MAG: hypothetical protein IS632_00740 [Thaumarchaeota archaeon]|nr:hypothetical protein [Nitrososphaerota archaeon]